jgi:glycosyltransferase involved in cell wall biosynthesis
MHGLDDVFFTGPVGLQEGLGGYFRAADVFLCLSEHEGFCVPLLEAMFFDIPVIAYRATGVPYTLGEAGILVTRKRYDVIGELIDLVTTDADLRRQIVTKQRNRLNDFAPEIITELLRKQISKIVGL